MPKRIRAGLDAWFAYVESHPFAWRLLFRDTTGLAELEAHHRQMRTQARAVIGQLLIEQLSLATTDAAPTAEFLRSAIVGLALWWLENPNPTEPEPAFKLKPKCFGTALGLNAARLSRFACQPSSCALAARFSSWRDFPRPSGWQATN